MIVIKGDLPSFHSLLMFTAIELKGSRLISVGASFFLIQLCSIGVSLIKSGDWFRFLSNGVGCYLWNRTFHLLRRWRGSRKMLQRLKRFLHLGKVAKTNLGTLCTGRKEGMLHPSSSNASLTLIGLWNYCKRLAHWGIFLEKWGLRNSKSPKYKNMFPLFWSEILIVEGTKPHLFFLTLIWASLKLVKLRVLVAISMRPPKWSNCFENTFTPEIKGRVLGFYTLFNKIPN